MSDPSFKVMLSEYTLFAENIVFDSTFENIKDLPSIDPENWVNAGMLTLAGEPLTVNVKVPVIDADEVDLGT